MQPEQQRAIELEEVNDYSIEEILENLEDALAYTDVIVNGYQISGNFTDATSIMFAGICKLRVAIENAMQWIGNENTEEEEKSDEEL